MSGIAAPSAETASVTDRGNPGTVFALKIHNWSQSRASGRCRENRVATGIVQKPSARLVPLTWRHLLVITGETIYIHNSLSVN